MAYIPPVSIPDLGGRDYSARLYGIGAGIGGAFYDNRRDAVEDQQFADTLDFRKSDADRNYALELWKAQQAAEAGADPSIYGSGLYYPDPTSQTGFGYGVWDKTGTMQPLTAPGGPVTVPAGPRAAGGAGWMPRTYESPGFLPPTTMVTTTAGEVPVARPGGGAVGPAVGGSAPGAVKAATTAGDIQGGIMANLPGARIQFEYIQNEIDKVKNDPSLGLVLGGGGKGGFGGILPTQASIYADVRDEGARVQNDLNYLRDQVFPIAYEMIKGAGPIAIFESQAAMKALQKLNNQQLSDEDFKAAMDDFAVKMDTMLRVLEAKAAGGVSGPAPAQPAYTSPGGIQIRAK